MDIKSHRLLLDLIAKAHKEHIWSKEWEDLINKQICDDCNKANDIAPNNLNQAQYKVVVPDLKR